MRGCLASQVECAEALVQVGWEVDVAGWVGWADWAAQEGLVPQGPAARVGRLASRDPEASLVALAMVDWEGMEGWVVGQEAKATPLLGVGVGVTIP